MCEYFPMPIISLHVAAALYTHIGANSEGDRTKEHYKSLGN